MTLVFYHSLSLMEVTELYRIDKNFVSNSYSLVDPFSERSRVVKLAPSTVFTVSDAKGLRD